MYYLLGDSAYKATNWLVVPYVSANNNELKSFNYKHASIRVKVENTIGKLKAIFKLLGTKMRTRDILEITVLIKSILPVYNILVQYNVDHYINDNEPIEEDFTPNSIHAPATHRPRTGMTISAHERREIMRLTLE